jgi:hypothetical protein
MQTSVKICGSCNIHRGDSKENYRLEVELLIAPNFQTNIYICTDFLHKYFDEEPCVYKCEMC